MEALEGADVVAAQTYRVAFVAPSTDATLASITVDGVPLAGFDPATTQYDDLQLLPGATPTVTATAADSKASVQVGAYDADAKSVLITVTAEDTAVTEQYVLAFVVDPRSWDASLSGLTVNGAAVPGFSADVLAYTVDIGAWGSAPSVAATATSTAATVATSTDLARATVTVTAENPGVTRTYTVTFTATSCVNQTAQAPWWSAAWGTETNASFCDGDGASFRISDANDGAWTTKDNLSVVFQPDVLAVGDSIETYVPSVEKGNNSDPRAGLVVRNDLSRAGKASAKAYALVVLSPAGGYLQYDSNNNGYIDTQTAAVPAATWPAFVKVEVTSSTSVTGYFRKASTDPWTKLASVPLASATAKLDAGIFAAGNNNRGASVATLLDTRFSFEVASVEPVTVETEAGTCRPAAAGRSGRHARERCRRVTRRRVGAHRSVGVRRARHLHSGRVDRRHRSASDGDGDGDPRGRRRHRTARGGRPLVGQRLGHRAARRRVPHHDEPVVGAERHVVPAVRERRARLDDRTHVGHPRGPDRLR